MKIDKQKLDAPSRTTQGGEMSKEAPDVIYALRDCRGHMVDEWTCHPPEEGKEDRVKYTLIPEGYVIVPIEPTQEMKAEGYEWVNCGDETKIWKAMIQAASQKKEMQDG